MGYQKLFCPMVRNMDNNEKSPPEEKKLKLDLREAMMNGFDDDDDIIELKDEVTIPPKENEAEVDHSDPLDLKFPDDEPEVDHRGPLDLKFPDDEPAEESVSGLDTPGTKTEEAEPQNVIDQADALTFEEEDKGEEDAEIQTHSVAKPLVMGDSDEVVEITEFDDILSEDDNEMITLVEESGDIELEDDEEEFLELIDVEEDSLPEVNSFLEEEEEEDKTVEITDEIIQFDGLKEDVEDVELEDFINDSLNEEIRIDDDLEDDLTSSLGVEAGSEMNMIDQASEAEDLDFNIDSREISEKIDQLDTIFFDDTEAQTDFEDEIISNDEEIEEAVSITGDAEDEDEDIPITDEEPSEEAMPQPEIAAFDDDLDEIEEFIAEDEEIPITDEEPSEETIPQPETAGFDADHDEMEESITDDEDIRITDDAPSEETMPQPGIAAFDADPDKIEASIERIIQQNYSEKIESMVVEVIEKAVSKEIDRLKNMLLEDNSPESS